MSPLLLVLLAALGPPPGPRVAPVPHDLHVSYGNAAVEGSLLILRLRLFKDDLEEALRRHAQAPQLTLEATPAVDGLFMAYLSENLSVTVAGARVPGRIVASGEDFLDREPVWWYTLQFDAPGDISALRVRNTLLFELFDDQRNVVKFVHFPDETQKTYAFGRGEEEFEVVLQGGSLERGRAPIPE